MDLAVGLTEVPSVNVQVVSCSVFATSMTEQVDSVELGALTEEEQKQVHCSPSLGVSRCVLHS